MQQRLFDETVFSYRASVISDEVQVGPWKVKRLGVLVKLKHLPTGDIKEFFLAGKSNVAPIQRHFDSLTDDLLLQWFKKREVKPAKKPK